MLLRPAFAGFEVEYATTNYDLAIREGINRIYLLPDSNRNQPIRALYCLWRSWSIVRQANPDFIITTGALPGLFCVVVGRLMGAKTIWIDSIANSDRSSMSGACARWFSSLWLTQWEHLAKPSGPRYDGALL
ncbi:glucuronosyltransferase [Sphingomonas sp.]|uniref:glucuronosyltransferase n=1 Tax=Sphingomonas sp. TaxID=28214 RepID=UPI0025CE4339|nr:glucuronosyltransferase [Sphingomonas sp.]